MNKMLFSFCFFCSFLVISAPKPEHFKVEVLTQGFEDPQEMAMLPNGDILICERTGSLKILKAGSTTLQSAGAIVVTSKNGEYARECGFIGLAVNPNFAKNNFIYCYYSNPAKHLKEYEEKFQKDTLSASFTSDKHVNKLSRFIFKDDKIVIESEKVLLEIPTDRYNSTCHEGGSIAFGPEGYLYLSTGDNTNPFSKPATPIEEDKKELDAQRSSSNSNDLRGKVLRLKVKEDGTVEIPEGNLFKPGTPKTRPEIYAMGLRNPYRITVNKKTGTLYWGEVSPDKTPTGEEINQAKTAGYYGWPYVITNTKIFKDLKGTPFDPKNLKNNSKNNTGIVDLPVPREPLHFYERSCSIIGEVYHMDTTNSKTAFPAYYDNCLFFADWNKSWFKIVRLDGEEKNVGVEDVPFNFKFQKPIDIFFKNGEMYVLEYGNGWYNVKSGRLLKISYSESFNQAKSAESDLRIDGMDAQLPGTKNMLTATCLSCHNAQVKVLGPSFVEIVDKYKNDPKAVELLVGKVKNGGTGVWGAQPMPPHPMYKDEEIKQFIEAILKTKKIEDGHKK